MTNLETSLSTVEFIRAARPSRGLRGGIILLALLLVAAAVWAAVTPYRVVVKAPGTLRAIPADETATETIAAAVSGRIRELTVREGDPVHKGQILVRLDTDRLDNEISRLQKLIATMEDELRRLRDLEDSLREYHRSGREQALALVRREEELLRREELLRQSQICRAESELEALRDYERRLAPLAEQGVATQSELKQVTEKRKQAEAALAAARAPLVTAPLEAARRALEHFEKESALRIEEHRIRVVSKSGELESARAQLAILQAERKEYFVVAPTDGIVTAVRARVGDVLTPSQPVLQVAQRSELRAELLVSAADIGLIRTGMPVRLKIDAFPHEQFGDLPGTVSFVSPDSERLPQGAVAYKVRVELSRQHLSGEAPLRLGMTLVGEFAVREQSVLSQVLWGGPPRQPR